jgi:hypothetical protein
MRLVCWIGVMAGEGRRSKAPVAVVDAVEWVYPERRRMFVLLTRCCASVAAGVAAANSANAANIVLPTYIYVYQPTHIDPSPRARSRHRIACSTMGKLTDRFSQPTYVCARPARQDRRIGTADEWLLHTPAALWSR